MILATTREAEMDFITYLKEALKNEVPKAMAAYRGEATAASLSEMEVEI